jgi:hypothetical protein
MHFRDDTDPADAMSEAELTAWRARQRVSGELNQVLRRVIRQPWRIAPHDLAIVIDERLAWDGATAGHIRHGPPQVVRSVPD